MYGSFGCKHLFLAIPALTLAACAPTATDGTKSGSGQSASTAGTLSAVSRNARSLGASVQRIGDDAIVVTYQGRPKGYFACTTKGMAGNFRSGAKLDARTNVHAGEGGIETETLYIATTSMDGEQMSLAFSDKEPGVLPDGGYCKSTQKLENTLVQAQ